MSEISNGDIFQLLCKMNGDIGAIKQGQQTQTDWMTAHVAEDKLMAADISALKMAGARQKGFLAAVAGVGGLVSGAVGYAVELLHRGN